MKRGWITSFLVAAVAAVATAEAAPHSFAAEVTVNHARDMVDCRAVVTDIGSGQALFKPRVFARQGEAAKAESDGSFDGQKYHAVLTVSSDATQTSYTIELLTEGAVVFRSKATVAPAK